MSKKTFLHEEQITLGAKMVPFASWEMPLQYSGIIDEVKTVRENVGLFDVSHMGEVFVYGNDALALLQKLVPQDVSKLKTSKALYSQLTNENGGIIDDLIIYMIEDKRYLLILNASRIDEDLNWMVRQSIGFDVEIDNKSHNYSLLAVQGPKASSVMEKMGLSKDAQPEFFTIKRCELFNINVFVSRTGYTGEDGFEILVKNEFSSYLWNKILENGEEFAIKPIGLGARDTLRLEAALHLYGNDLDETTTPIEAGLTWSVSKSKTVDYVGKKIIQNQLINGTEKKLVAFEMTEKAIARAGYEVFLDGEKIGSVSSGGYSPTLDKNIGLAYIKTSSNLKLDHVLEIMVRNKLYKAKIVKKPFVEKKNKI